MRKFLNKIYAVSLVIAFLSVCFSFAWTIRPKVVHAAEETFFKEELSKESIFYSDIMSQYRRTSSDRKSTDGWVYDEQFAGVWYDESGKLNVGVTIGHKSSNRDQKVIYHNNKFSFNSLKEIHRTISELMPMYSIFSVATTPQYNKVEVSLSNGENISDIIEHLSELLIFEKEAISFIVGEAPRPNSASIHSGQNIHTMNESSKRGTIGAKAYCNKTGARGVVTNQHVAPNNTMMRMGPTQGVGAGTGTYVGKSAQTQYGGKVDAAFVPFNDVNWWQCTSSASFWNHPNLNQPTVIPTTYQVASKQEIVVGQSIAQFGDSTGRTNGYITAIDCEFRMDDILGLGGTLFTDQIKHTAYTEQGDSGGPVFITSGGRYTLAGIHSANYTFANVYVNGFASKITNVAEALDVTIMGEVEQPVKNGTEYRIRNAQTNQYMTIEGSNTGTGMRVMQANFNGSARQVFYARTNSDGSFSLEPKVNINAKKANTRVDLSYVFPSYYLLKIQTANTTDRQKLSLSIFDHGSCLAVASGHSRGRTLEPFNNNEIHEVSQQNTLRQRWVFEPV